MSVGGKGWMELQYLYMVHPLSIDNYTIVRFSYYIFVLQQLLIYRFEEHDMFITKL